VLSACGGDTPPPPPPNPPQVFITAAQTALASTSLPLTINITGCQKVVVFELWHDKTRIVSLMPSKYPANVELTGADLQPLYGTLGIAPNLSLFARGFCDDGRKNDSLPVGVRFLPVERTFETATGAPALPDGFIAEGGSGNTPTTFVGCIGTTTGTVLGRVNQEGQVLAVNMTLPFPCTATSTITELTPSTGKRWLLEPGVGAFAFDQGMNISSVFTGGAVQIAVDPLSGDAAIWINNALTQDSLFRVRHTGGTVWAARPLGIMNGVPVVNNAIGQLITPFYLGDAGGQPIGTLTVQKFEWDTGRLVARNDMKLQQYSYFAAPQIPNAAFNSDASVIYFPFQAAGPTSTRTTSGVLACGTDVPNCAEKWTTALFDGVIGFIVPFSSGSQLAAITASKTYFISTTNGQQTNFNGLGIAATGSLSTIGAQPGLGTDFYLLDGLTGGYPTEVVGIDAPMSGELWRFALPSGGGSPQSALWLAVDEAGTVWMRIGTKLVKPLTNEQYRTAKGGNR
jgi:hypothetical protein